MRVKKMRFRKGLSGNPNGRPKGAKNKLPRNLVDRVLEISAKLDEQGKGLQDCAEQDPKWFFENFIKPILPKNVDLRHQGQVGCEHELSEELQKKLDEILQEQPNHPAACY
jgi:hypothetical protein